MNQLSAETLNKALLLLGEVLELRDRPPHHFIVCGGSSLIALGLVRRSVTQDVDILARLDSKRVVSPRPLPDWLIEAAEAVRSQLNLPKDWLNAEVADDTFFHCGLPEGLVERLSTRDYGPRLRIGFISRRDQIFLKLHAAVDRDGGRHLQDLMELAPTADELLDAAHWTRSQDPSDGFRILLCAMLTRLGHENLVEQL